MELKRVYLQDDPTVKRGMVNDNAPFSHHLFGMAQAQGISKIPANTLRDDIDRIMQEFKGFSGERYGQVKSKKTACYLTTP